MSQGVGGGRRSEFSERNQERLRNLIKVEEIIRKLESHILGKVKMTGTMVRAAEILLRKVQPDLTATAISDSRDDSLPVLKIVRRPKPKPKPGPELDDKAGDAA